MNMLKRMVDNKPSPKQGRHASATTWLVKVNGSIVFSMLVGIAKMRY